jgi:type VI secretion system protein ImpH
VFPANDIESIRDHTKSIELILTFMGLAGVSSPLPLYFTEYVSRNPETGAAMHDFLSMFNHRMYTLFYRAWQKYRFSGLQKNAAHPIMHRLCSLASIDNTAIADKLKKRLIAYTASFSQKNRSSAGLRLMLSDFFGGIPVTILQWQPRLVTIVDKPKLGVTMQLGVSSIIGTQKLDCAGKFSVTIGPLDREQFSQFLPQSENIAAMKKIIGLYVSDPLEFDIKVSMKSSEFFPVILGHSNALIGLTAMLGKPEEAGGAQSVVVW